MSGSYYKSPSNKHSSVIIWLCLVILIVFVVWSMFAKINQTTRATGVVIARDRTQTVQAVDGGVLTQLLVNEGDDVKKGQLLIVLQEESALASLESTSSRVASLRARVDRLEAQLMGRPLVFDDTLDNYPQYKDNQRALYQRQNELLQSEIAFFESSLSFARQELSLREPLLDIGAVSQAEVARAKHNVEEIEAQIKNRNNRFYADTQNELTDAQELLYIEEQLLREKKQQLLEKRLHAPSSGKVNHITNTTIGSVFRAGDNILEILPSNSELIVEVKISPTDIASVQEGQEAKVKLDAYDYTIFGVLTGKVTYISPDILTEQSQGELKPFYRVQITILKAAKQSHPKSGEIVLKAGMTASVDIIAKERTVLSYLTKPITKTLSEGMTER